MQKVLQEHSKLHWQQHYHDQMEKALPRKHCYLLHRLFSPSSACQFSVEQSLQYHSPSYFQITNLLVHSPIYFLLLLSHIRGNFLQKTDIWDVEETKAQLGNPCSDGVRPDSTQSWFWTQLLELQETSTNCCTIVTSTPPFKNSAIELLYIPESKLSLTSHPKMTVLTFLQHCTGEFAESSSPDYEVGIHPRIFRHKIIMHCGRSNINTIPDWIIKSIEFLKSIFSSRIGVTWASGEHHCLGLLRIWLQLRSMCWFISR